MTLKAEKYRNVIIVWERAYKVKCDELRKQKRLTNKLQKEIEELRKDNYNLAKNIIELKDLLDTAFKKAIKNKPNGDKE